MSSHGHTYKNAAGNAVVTTTYRAWQKLKHRCKKHAKGNPGPWCSYDERWQKFAGFLEDMGERPDGMVLVRADDRAPFGKDNCFWGQPQPPRVSLTRSPRQSQPRKLHGKRRVTVVTGEGPAWPWDVWETLTPSEQMAWKVLLDADSKGNYKLAAEMLGIIRSLADKDGGSGNVAHLGFLGYIFYWQQ